MLLIVIDDLRTSLSCYGDTYALIPSIDDIADRGVIFKNAYAQQALCGPSRTSFLTSRRPDATKTIDVHYYWREHAGNFTTLPQYFREHGYITQSAGKVFHPGIVSGHDDDQSFSWSGEPFHPKTHAYMNICPHPDGSTSADLYCPVKVSEQPGATLPDIESTEFAVNWLKNLNASDKPFFLAVGFHKPHVPFKFPEEFLRLFPLADVPLPRNRHPQVGLPTVAWNPWNDIRRREDVRALNISFPYGPIPDEYAKLIVRGYYASVTYVDALVGILVDTVRNLAPDTTIALVSDHGWSLGEHGEWAKYSNYDVATKVPFVISVPGESKPKMPMQRMKSDNYREYFDQYIRRNEDPERRYSGMKKSYRLHEGMVELLDLFPTLVDLSGIKSIRKCTRRNRFKKSTCTEGNSLACIIYGGKCPTTKHWAMSQYPRPSIRPSRHPDSDQPRLVETSIMGYSLNDKRFRYTLWLGFDGKSFKPNSTIYGEELYDHSADPAENYNIVQNKQSNFLKHAWRSLLQGRVGPLYEWAN